MRLIERRADAFFVYNFEIILRLGCYSNSNLTLCKLLTIEKKKINMDNGSKTMVVYKPKKLN